MEGNWTEVDASSFADVKAWARGTARVAGRRPLLTESQLARAIDAHGTAADSSYEAEVRSYFEVVPDATAASRITDRTPIKFTNRVARRAARRAQTKARKLHR